MSAPSITYSEVIVVCECGEEHQFDGIHDGWQHIWPCECGRRVSVQFDDPILQYDRPVQAVQS